MSVIRIKKAHRKPYVILDTTALNDARLSYRAKGLHTYLMSKPDDWSIYIEQLERESPKEGRDAIRAAMQELIIAGYVHRQRVRDERGRMSGWDTTVYETPELADDEQANAIPPAKNQKRTEIGLSEVGVSENGLPEVGSTEVGSTENGLAEVGKSDATNYGLNQGLNPPRIEITHNPLPPGLVNGEVNSCQRCDDAFAIYTDGFKALCAVYPADRQEGLAEAWQTWRARDLEPRHEEFVAKVTRLVETTWRARERRYIPLLKTWLDKGRYDDPLVLEEEVKPQVTYVSKNQQRQDAIFAPEAMKSVVERTKAYEARRRGQILPGTENTPILLPRRTE